MLRCWGQFHYYRKTSGAFKWTKKALKDCLSAISFVARKVCGPGTYCKDTSIDRQTSMLPIVPCTQKTLEPWVDRFALQGEYTEDALMSVP
jgi:hypothetical protein